jgi:hypothetical protein
MMLERSTSRQGFSTPDSIKCPKCGRYGKGPLVRENGDVHIRHTVSKERPDKPSGCETHGKRSIYCQIAKRGVPV